MPQIKVREYDQLQKEIRRMEEDLFAKKEQIEAVRVLHQKPVLFGPSPYRCATCGNTSCLNYGLMETGKREGVIIANTTAMCGCLSWLPGVS